MIAYLKLNPFRIDTDGDLLICDNTLMHDADEPITPLEVKAINAYLGKKVLKTPRWWRIELSRADAVGILINKGVIHV